MVERHFRMHGNFISKYKLKFEYERILDGTWFTREEAFMSLLCVCVLDRFCRFLFESSLLFIVTFNTEWSTFVH